MSRFTFTSESVTEGHPDKMADQISDSILDAILAEDPTARVACETLVTTGLALVAGEITTSAQGAQGFGYDPIFWVSEMNKTAAELTGEEKNRLSHRGKALRQLQALLLKDRELENIKQQQLTPTSLKESN